MRAYIRTALPILDFKKTRITCILLFLFFLAVGFVVVFCLFVVVFSCWHCGKWFCMFRWCCLWMDWWHFLSVCHLLNTDDLNNFRKNLSGYKNELFKGCGNANPQQITSAFTGISAEVHYSTIWMASANVYVHLHCS